MVSHPQSLPNLLAFMALNTNMGSFVISGELDYIFYQVITNGGTGCVQKNKVMN